MVYFLYIRCVRSRAVSYAHTSSRDLSRCGGFCFACHQGRASFRMEPAGVACGFLPVSSEFPPLVLRLAQKLSIKLSITRVKQGTSKLSIQFSITIIKQGTSIEQGADVSSQQIAADEQSRTRHECRHKRAQVRKLHKISLSLSLSIPIYTYIYIYIYIYICV